MYKKFGSISRRFRHGLVAAFLLCLLPALASSQGIPSTLGWYQIPNTALRSVCAADHGFPQFLRQHGMCGNYYGMERWYI